MIYYNIKVMFENFENINKFKVDCEMIYNKKEEEKYIYIYIEK